MKVLTTQPGVAVAILCLLVRLPVAGPVDLDDQSPLEADEVDDEFSDGNLPAKFNAPASMIAKISPEDRFRLNGYRALLAGETKESGRIGRHGDRLARGSGLRKAQSRLARLDTPHLSGSA